MGVEAIETFVITGKDEEDTSSEDEVSEVEESETEEVVVDVKDGVKIKNEVDEESDDDESYDSANETEDVGCQEEAAEKGELRKEDEENEDRAKPVSEDTLIASSKEEDPERTDKKPTDSEEKSKSAEETQQESSEATLHSESAPPEKGEDTKSSSEEEDADVSDEEFSTPEREIPEPAEEPQVVESGTTGEDNEKPVDSHETKVEDAKTEESKVRKSNVEESKVESKVVESKVEEVNASEGADNEPSTISDKKPETNIEKASDEEGEEASEGKKKAKKGKKKKKDKDTTDDQGEGDEDTKSKKKKDKKDKKKKGKDKHKDEDAKAVAENGDEEIIEEPANIVVVNELTEDSPAKESSPLKDTDDVLVAEVKKDEAEVKEIRLNGPVPSIVVDEVEDVDAEVNDDTDNDAAGTAPEVHENEVKSEPVQEEVVVNGVCCQENEVPKSVAPEQPITISQTETAPVKDAEIEQPASKEVQVSSEAPEESANAQDVTTNIAENAEVPAPKTTPETEVPAEANGSEATPKEATPKEATHAEAEASIPSEPPPCQPEDTSTPVPQINELPQIFEDDDDIGYKEELQLKVQETIPEEVGEEGEEEEPKRTYSSRQLMAQSLVNQQVRLTDMLGSIGKRFTTINYEVDRLRDNIRLANEIRNLRKKY